MTKETHLRPDILLSEEEVTGLYISCERLYDGKN